MVASTLAPWHQAKLDSGSSSHCLGILARGIIHRDFVPPSSYSHCTQKCVRILWPAATRRPTFGESPVYYWEREGLVSLGEDNNKLSAASVCVCVFAWIGQKMCRWCMTLCMTVHTVRVDTVCVWSFMCLCTCVYVHTPTHITVLRYTLASTPCGPGARR